MSKQFTQSFIRYSAADCFRDAASWLDQHPDHIVVSAILVDNGNNPSLVIAGDCVGEKP